MADTFDFQEVPAGTYYVEPIPEASTRVLFTVPDGWLSWAGSFKPSAENEDEYVSITIGVVSELPEDPCLSHTWTDPGPTVADMAEGLASRPGIVVIQAPEQVSAFGTEGEHLIVEVPGIEFDPTLGSEGFVDCVSGTFQGWRGPDMDSRYYQGPRQYLEFWVFDVEGERLLIEASHFPSSTGTDLAELDAVIESISIEG